MRVEDKSSLKSADSPPAKPAGDRSAVAPQADKVSLESAKRVEAIVQAVQSGLSVDRNVRLQELESAIRQGRYQPNVSQLAEKIVRAAEVDARLRAIFGG